MSPEIVDQPITDYYGPLAWANRYMIDWAACAGPVSPIRAYTTIIRWFCAPEERVPQWTSAKRYFDPHLPMLSDQHERNLYDLLACEVEIDCGIDRRRLGLFFASLHDGDLIDGGPTPDWIPLLARMRRPGAAYLWGKWNQFFPKRGPLWPFYMFPRKEVFLTP